MFCCGKDRDGKFCPECGAGMGSDLTKRNIVEYFDLQARKVRGYYETRKKYNPDWAESGKKGFEDKIKKWEEWRDWAQRQAG